MASWYFALLRFPKTLLTIVILLTLVAAYNIKYFSFEASADTLVVQGDPKLAQYNEMSELFGGDEFIVLTYSSDNVVSVGALKEIHELQEQLNQLPGVMRTFSILDAPLIESPPIALEDLSEQYRTLRAGDVDLDLARAELTSSPLFSNYLIAVDGRSTAIRVDLVRDDELAKLISRRDYLRLHDSTSDQLGDIERAHDRQRAAYVARRDELISACRKMRDDYKGKARLFVSGVPMIAADMLSFVKSDIIVFGALVLMLIITLLALFFRKPRWVLIPLVVCLITAIWTMGILGALRTPVTVVSSNFISLLSIVSISFSIHLVVRYRELLAGDASYQHWDLVAETMRSKFAPCFYTALTTLLAFGSLLGSKIVPIEDFAWMMCLGIAIAFIVTYLIFPTLLLTMGLAAPSKTLGQNIWVTDFFQSLSTTHTSKVLIVTAICLVPATYGVLQITFDNKFTDYFGNGTEIRRGLVHIDEHLGGTIPLDIYVRFEEFDVPKFEEDDFFSQEGDSYPERYWYTPYKFTVLQDIQTKLDARPEMGKVFSLASLEQAARRFNNNQPLDGVAIAYVLGELPEEIRSFLIEPYGKPKEGWLRINARINETAVDFSKDDLISDIERYAIDDLELETEDVVVTGMVVLFNNMLQQLADSQQRTLAYVIIATFTMFSVLLRSVQLAFIALVPNIIGAMLVLAFMGFARIPMDMMTVTIASISIGIGVDDAIHFLHRFQYELDRGASVRQAVIKAHQTIGRAMYFTTMTVMGGFCILALSNFVPTVNFGLLTTLAMGLALMANTTVLPSLLIAFYKSKPAVSREPL